MTRDAVIAGSLPLTRVMSELALRRRVFHSEADFQFAFAQVASRLDPSIEMRLEVRQPGDARESVDLVCLGQRTTFLEFKYCTTRWQGVDPMTDEVYELRHHGAAAVARLNFVHDVRRLERFTDAGGAHDGVALIVTNVSGLWSSPGNRVTYDHAFRIHEGATLSGLLEWGSDPQSRYTHRLRGSYVAEWSDYAPRLPGRGGTFRWLALPVSSPTSD